MYFDNPVLMQRVVKWKRYEEEIYDDCCLYDWSMCYGTIDLLCLCFNERRFQVMSTVIQYILYLAILVVLAIPLGAYIKKVMNGEKTFLSKILTPPVKMPYIK